MERTAPAAGPVTFPVLGDVRGLEIRRRIRMGPAEQIETGERSVIKAVRDPRRGEMVGQ